MEITLHQTCALLGSFGGSRDTTLFELVDLAFAAGNGIGISFISLTPDQPE